MTERERIEPWEARQRGWKLAEVEPETTLDNVAEFVTAVLLGGHWQRVEPGSFYLSRADLTAGVPGFGFRDAATGDRIVGPVDAIQALRYNYDDAETQEQEDDR